MRQEFLVILVAVSLAATPSAGKVADYVGTVETVGVSAEGETARGTVFLDANRNSRRDAEERGLAGVPVSNGREVTVTGPDGRYALPARTDMTLFVTKPAGYAVPVDADLVPQFAYAHKPAGSPELRHGGLAPTGPLPAEINFPLVPDPVGPAFRCLVLADPQPHSGREVGYLRETATRMLLNRDTGGTECLLVEGDVAGDDLGLYPRIAEVLGAGGVPQYWVPGNHDLDLDAGRDRHSLDTFRATYGPDYYSFDIGAVHFVVLDNVRYPCNGVDAHPFCRADAPAAFNGVVHDRQMTWLANDLARVPDEKLIVLNAHMPFQSFTHAGSAQQQTDNLAELAEILEGRRVLALSGHTHTTENLPAGLSYAGWEQATGLAAAPFHQIVAGAVSGSWWQGDLDDTGVPHATQRLGSPRGYYTIEFEGADYVDTFHAFGRDTGERFHAAFNTPRFRDWAAALYAFADAYDLPVEEVTPPVTRRDLGDPYRLTRADLAGGTWATVNVWHGSPETEVRVSLDGGAPTEAVPTQPGTGEAPRTGAAWADPLALAKQATQSDMAVRSTRGGAEEAGYRVFHGTQWAGIPQPFPRSHLSDSSQHLWRVEMPGDLALGLHVMTVEVTDRHGRVSERSYGFEVVAD